MQSKMFRLVKVVHYSILALTIGLFVQQLNYIFYAVEAKAYDQRRSNYPQQQSYSPNSGNQYVQSGNQAGRYAPNIPQNSIGGGTQRRSEHSNGFADCNSQNGNETHMYTITVPNDAIKKYTYVKILDNKPRQSTISICCPGYVLERNLKRDVCSPVCENCRNGQCVGPNECECYDGFVRNDNGDCVFSCPLGCLNGQCYLDGSCKCDPGYKLDESRRFCRPICSKGCGTNPLLNCTEPEVCGCINGYILTDGGCQAVCTPECGPGGECNGFGVCECKPGYTLKDGVCHAICYQSCENGICYSRHRCICNPGFVYMETTGNCIEKE